MSQQPDSDLQAELDAVRHRLGDLEAAHRELLRSASRSGRPGFSRKFLLGVLPVVLLVATGGLLYGQGAGDPLFIHPNGNVGIGTTSPGATLDVSGKADTDEQVSLQLRSGNNGSNFESNQITFGWSGSDTYRHAIKSRHNGSGQDLNALDFYVWKHDKAKPDSKAIGGLHTMTLNGGKVGIGTTDPKNALDVKGGLAIGATYAGSQPAPANGAIIEGNVGIGMMGPNARLQVDSPNPAASQALILSNSNPDNAADEGVYQSYYVGGTGGNEMARILAANKTDKDLSDGYLAFSTRNGNEVTEKVRIDNTGNVGIGTTGPEVKLHVDNGALKVRAGHDSFNANIGQFVANNKSQGIGIGYNSIQAIGSNANQDIIIKPKGDGTVYLDGPVVVKGFGVNFGTGTDVAYLQLIPYNNGYMAWRKAGAPSDERLKTDLRQIPNAVDKVRRLRGVTYHWNERGLQSLTGDIESSISAGPNATEEENQNLWQTERERRYKELAKINVGIVAQDVEAVLPEAVTTDEKGYKSVRYHYLIPLLIEALKEQDKTVKDQAQVVAQQQQEIARLTAANLAVQHQLVDLIAVKAQVAQLEAGMQHVTATQALSTPGAVAHLSETEAH